MYGDGGLDKKKAAETAAFAILVMHFKISQTVPVPYVFLY
jgi:hypothetical protein